MTTETTSQTLHERLLKANAAGIQRNRNGGIELWLQVPVNDLAAIEADLIAEATASLRAEIDSRKKIERDLVSECNILRATVDEYDLAYAQLKCQNAALRTAGTEVRNAADKMLGALDTWKMPRSGVEARLETAVMKWDAATTPRDRERKEYGWPIYTNAAGLPEISVVCENCHKSQYYWPLNDAGELELSPSEIGCECTLRAEETPMTSEPYDGVDFVQAAHDAADRDKRYHEAKAAPSPTDAESNDPEIPDSCPTDAAGEGYSPELAIDGLFPYIEDFDERITALEARADDARERLEDLIVKHDTLMRSQINEVLSDIQRDEKRRHRKLKKHLTKRVNRHHAWTRRIGKGQADLLNRIDEINEETRRQMAEALATLRSEMGARTTPQPVAVTPEVTDLMIEAYYVATMYSTLPARMKIHAGLTAALVAKEAGK